MSRAAYRKADTVRADLLDATLELLSERPAGDLTVREIAARAGVQHSLITRHFGSKDALIAEAVGMVASQYAREVASADDPADGFARGIRHLRAAPSAGFVLTAPAERRAGDDADERFPGLAVHLQALLAAGADDDTETRVLAGILISMVIGWSVGRDTVMEAMDLPKDRTTEVDSLAEEIVARLVRSQLPDAPTARDR